MGPQFGLDLYRAPLRVTLYKDGSGRRPGPKIENEISMQFCRELNSLSSGTIVSCLRCLLADSEL